MLPANGRAGVGKGQGLWEHRTDLEPSPPVISKPKPENAQLAQSRQHLTICGEFCALGSTPGSSSVANSLPNPDMYSSDCHTSSLLRLLPSAPDVAERLGILFDCDWCLLGGMVARNRGLRVQRSGMRTEQFRSHQTLHLLHKVVPLISQQTRSCKHCERKRHR